MTRAYRVLAVFWVLLALVPGYYAVTLDWAPRIDFDIIGFLFVIQNAPRLLAWALTIGCLFGAVAMYLRSKGIGP